MDDFLQKLKKVVRVVLYRPAGSIFKASRSAIQEQYAGRVRRDQTLRNVVHKILNTV